KFFLENITLTRKEASKQLDITTRTFRDHLIPGQQEEWSFVVKTEQGKAVIAEMMAGMYDASLDKIRPHYWNFNPVYSTYSITPRWRYNAYPQNGYLSERIKWTNVPEFKYDVLNLYGLNQFGFSNRAQIMARGYEGGVPGALTEEAQTEDADIAFAGKVAGVSSLSNSDTKFYTRGLSSFKESRDEAPAADELASPEIRQNFQETAFFFPQLLTDSTGNVVIKFTVPESTTTWKFMALAHTPTMQFGQIEKSVVTNKEFMVSTNLPRFVRTGDKVVLQATISNLTSEVQQGEAYLELFNPSTEVVINKQQVTFNTKPQENQTVSFEFTAPQNMDLLGCRIVASSSKFSDGEQHVLPVVPDATLVTQALPIFTNQQGQQTFKLNAPKGITPYRLTLELTANPIWYAVLALPTINTPQTDNVTEITASYYVSTLATAIANANPQITNTIRQWMQKPDAALTSPLEKNQELKSILLQLSPWVTEAQNETQQMRSLGELLDVNRQNYISQQAINKLAELQNEDGGWSWFKGFTSSTFMTENVLEAMARLVSLNVTSHPEQVKKMQIKALQFLDKQIQESYKYVKTAGYSQILYLYTRSAYRDIPLTNALEAHKYYLGQLKASWTKLSLYEKALTAIAMERYGKTDIAKQIIRSLKEYSTTTPEMGMYWANNRSSLFTNSAIQTHVAIMSAFREIEGNSTDTELMKQWLLRQKQTQSWGSTPTTVDAIYALLLTGNNQLASPEDLSVKLGNKNLNVSPEETTLGYIKQTFTGKEITSKMMNVTLSKKQQQASWGGLYLQYFEKLDKITSHSSDISVKKDLFIQKESNNGNTLTPLAGQNLQVGDRICIRITVTNNQDMQFVHLKDLRAGCFEPTEQLSGKRWQDNISYYQETTDVATNFFFDFLPKGTHVFEYTVWIAQSGTYQDGIATLQCVYAPQYSANSDAGSVTVQ
ncbi:MAG TPA: alpha-2-macroglobulin, partial [Butyricimonas virosa]|nr:alpha-2-macroglobulin [Butyricimonas virosa]